MGMLGIHEAVHTEIANRKGKTLSQTLDLNLTYLRQLNITAQSIFTGKYIRCLHGLARTGPDT